MESCEYGMELFPPAMRGMVEIVRYNTDEQTTDELT